MSITLENISLESITLEFLLGCIVILLMVLIFVVFIRKPKGGSPYTAQVTQLGPYRNLQLISDKGGMARIFKAFDTVENQDVVLKILRSDCLGQEDIVNKFRQEAEILTKIKEKLPEAPVVSVFATGTDSTGLVDLPYIAMQYIPGSTDLSDYLKKHGKVTLKTAEKIIVQVIRGLAVASDIGVIHRDLKPENILLYNGDPEKLLVCDFGVAKQIDAESKTQGAWITAPYMSPEQCSPESKITPASDVYSLGVIFYELLTGNKLFNDVNPVQVMKQHEEEDPTPLITANIPEKYQKILSALLDKTAENRPEMNEILSHFSASAVKVKGYKSPKVETVVTDFKSRRGGGLLKNKLAAGLAGLLLILIGALVTVSINQDPISTKTSLSQPGQNQPSGPGTNISSQAPFYSQSQQPARKDMAGPFGRLNITSKPPGATIYVDSRLKGTTPLSLNQISTGNHLVIAKLKHYADKARAIQIERDADANIYFDLKKGVGILTIYTTPAMADIFLDDVKIKAKTPVTIKSISAGKHKISSVKKGYKTKVETLDVLPSKTVRLDMVLEKSSLGKLYVKTEPMWATIKILNIKPKFAQGIELNPGKYNVKVSAKGYQTKNYWISLKTGEEKVESVELIKSKKIITKNRLHIITDPPGASVRIGNNDWGKTPLHFDSKLGHVTVQLKKNGYKTLQQTIRVTNKGPSYLRVKLEPANHAGTIAIMGSPHSAAIYIDGKYQGKIPFKHTKINAGEHRVEVKKDGYQNWSNAVSIAEGDIKKIRVRLKKLKKLKKIKRRARVISSF